MCAGLIGKKKKLKIHWKEERGSNSQHNMPYLSRKVGNFEVAPARLNQLHRLRIEKAQNIIALVGVVVGYAHFVFSAILLPLSPLVSSFIASLLHTPTASFLVPVVVVFTTPYATTHTLEASLTWLIRPVSKRWPDNCKS